jgi:glycerophosphoryl diester phosphodiesterase
LIATDKSPLVIGHRGSSALAPENTLAAFARALRDGAAGIELDVRLSRDSVPVVIHDATLRSRLRKRLVSRMTAEQLQQTDVGSWFNQRHRRLARLEYLRQTITTLDEVFALIDKDPDKRFIVYAELKCGQSRKKNEDLVRQTLNVINRRQMQKRVVVISFNLRTVAHVKEMDPSIRTGALFGPRTAVLKRADKIIAAAIRSGANEVLLHHRIATKTLTAAAHRHQLPVVVWTVDNPKWIKRAGELGFHALMTNNPSMMLRANAD